MPRSSSTELTTTELAQASGVPVTTLRMYQQRGLIEPPERRGRNAVYGRAHVERLALIRHLQDRGYSLAAIRDVTQRDSRAIDRILDTEVPALADEPITMTLLELVQRLPVADFSLETIQRTQELGVLVVDGPTVVVTQPAFLEAGAALTALGVPTAAILDAYETLRDQVRAIARDFVGLFDDHLLPGLDLTDADAIHNRLDALSRAALDVVAAELRHALRDLTRRRITDSDTLARA